MNDTVSAATEKLFPKLSVLVVNADDNLTKLLGSVLISLGVRQIQNAANGAEGLRLLNAASPGIAVVLTGYRMQPMDGIALARAVRNPDRCANPYVPLIMVTGDATPALVKEAREAGINEFLVTPVSVKAVSDRIAVAVAKPRPFIKASSYFGPDRRRRTIARGDERRHGQED